MADNRLNSKIQRLVFNLISVLLKTYGLVFGQLFSEIKTSNYLLVRYLKIIYKIQNYVCVQV